MMIESSYAKYYSSARVIARLQQVFSKAGLDVVGRVLQLYYLAKSPQVPVWGKATIFAALGYFVLTPDAIPDISPVIGFVDDLAVLSSALASVAAFLTPEIQAKVSSRLEGLFGVGAKMPLENLKQQET